MPKIKHNLKVVAIVTIRNASRMTPARRKGIADWLRVHARMLVTEGHLYSTRFTGRCYR